MVLAFTLRPICYPFTPTQSLGPDSSLSILPLPGSQDPQLNYSRLAGAMARIRTSEPHCNDSARSRKGFSLTISFFFFYLSESDYLFPPSSPSICLF